MGCFAAALLSWTAVAVGGGSNNSKHRPSVLFCTPEGLFAQSRTWVDLEFLRGMHNKSDSDLGFEVDWTASLADINQTRIARYDALVLWVSAASLSIRPNPASPATQAGFAGVILDYIGQGGGVLLFPTETNVWGQKLFDITSQLGGRLPIEFLNETNASNVQTMRHMKDHGSSVKMFYSTNIDRSHPLAAGVGEGVWYPSMPAYNAAHGGPIDVNEQWTSIVRATTTTHTVPVNLQTTTIRPLPPAEQIFQHSPPVSAPTLFAVRERGKGRVALLNQWRQYTTGSGTGWLFDSQILSTGSDKRPSGFGRLLRNTFGWLTEPMAGTGYITPAGALDAPNSKPEAFASYKEVHPSYNVSDLSNHDPADPSLKLVRGLIGIRTSLSTGSDTLEQIAYAARAANVDYVVVLEQFCVVSDDGKTVKRLSNATLQNLAVSLPSSCTRGAIDH